MLGKNKGREDAYAEIMLTSCIDLFMSIIAFLLMCVGFNHFRVINASVPTISEGPLAPGQSDKELTLVVHVRSRGLEVSGTGDDIEPRALAAIRRYLPKQKGIYDVEALNHYLAQIKGTYPRGSTLMLLADEHVLYDDIVKIMDSARSTRTAFASGAPTKTLLYPNVVLSSLQRSPL